MPDRVLDLEELIGIRLASGANEDVAILIARTATAQSLTNNASLDRGRHATILAQSPEDGVWVAAVDTPSAEQYGVVDRFQSCRYRAGLEAGIWRRVLGVPELVHPLLEPPAAFVSDDDIHVCHQECLQAIVGRNMEG